MPAPGDHHPAVRDQAFVIPSCHWWEGPFYGIGMKVYDQLAGKLGLSPSRMLSREETIEAIPTVETNQLTGGKWTTYRKMAEDVIDHAETVAGGDPQRCETRCLQIHGWTQSKLMAKELGKDDAWESGQVATCTRLARGYVYTDPASRQPAVDQSACT